MACPSRTWARSYPLLRRSARGDRRPNSGPRRARRQRFAPRLGTHVPPAARALALAHLTASRSVEEDPSRLDDAADAARTRRGHHDLGRRLPRYRGGVEDQVVVPGLLGVAAVE